MTQYRPPARVSRILPFIEDAVLQAFPLFSDQPLDALKGLNAKLFATMRWLLLTAAQAHDEANFERTVQLCEVIGVPDQAIPAFDELPSGAINPANPPLPPFIRSMNAASTGVLTRLSLNGVTHFYTNSEFSEWFFSGLTANQMYHTCGKDEDKPISEVLAQGQDLNNYLQKLCDMLVTKPHGETETEMIAQCRFKDSSVRSCHLQIRCSTSANGTLFATAVRITPMKHDDNSPCQNTLALLDPQMHNNKKRSLEQTSGQDSSKRVKSHHSNEECISDDELMMWLAVDQDCVSPSDAVQLLSEGELLRCDTVNFDTIFTEDDPSVHLAGVMVSGNIASI